VRGGREEGARPCGTGLPASGLGPVGLAKWHPSRGPRPRLLDLFCGAGGTARGYHDAGFEVVGVDIEPQPNYPYAFVQHDALTLDPAFVAQFDAVHASPPCQKHTAAAPLQGLNHADLIPGTREMLRRSGLPYVIENVPGAPLIYPVTICGLALDCNVKRHRLFESNFLISGTECPKGHPGDWLIVFGYSALRRSRGQGTGPKKDRGKSKGKSVPHGEASAAMGIDWMSRMELSQAIPPAYTQFIGKQLLAHLQLREAA
jgi:DNA (cytosine-5)-methyltransferase 1